MDSIGLTFLIAFCLTTVVASEKFFNAVDNFNELQAEKQQVDDGDLDYEDPLDDLDDLLEDSGSSDGSRRRASQTGISVHKVNEGYITRSIQLAISTTLKNEKNSKNRDLLLADFEETNSADFPKRGTDNTPGHGYYNFKFKSYAPLAYQHFRAMFYRSAEEYIASVGSPEQPLRALGNPGASGSSLYLSHDDTYIIKTLQPKENEFLVKLLPQYYMNLKQNPKTLLPKFFGQYSYIGAGRHMRMVVMNNLIPSAVRLDEKFDLKGSTHKRQANELELSKSSPTFKDLDFLERHKNGFLLEPDVYDSLMDTLAADLRVLESYKIMDFSLLIGIHSMDKVRKSTLIEQMTIDKLLSDNSLAAIKAKTEEGENVVLFLGLIDILQDYSLEKNLEHTLKSMIHNGDTISVHNPSYYAKRFLKFMGNKVFRRG